MPHLLFDLGTDYGTDSELDDMGGGPWQPHPTLPQQRADSSLPSPPPQLTEWARQLSLPGIGCCGRDCNHHE